MNQQAPLGEHPAPERGCFSGHDCQLWAPVVEVKGPEEALKLRLVSRFEDGRLFL